MFEMAEPATKAALAALPGEARARLHAVIVAVAAG